MRTEKTEIAMVQFIPLQQQQFPQKIHKALGKHRKPLEATLGIHHRE